MSSLYFMMEDLKLPGVKFIDFDHCLPDIEWNVILHQFIYNLCEHLNSDYFQKYPIEWRQNALKRIVGMFEKDSATAHDMNVVKMLQHIVIPSLHYAFERYDVDVVPSLNFRIIFVSEENSSVRAGHEVTPPPHRVPLYEGIPAKRPGCG